VPFISRLSHGAHAGKLAGDRVVTYSMIFELITALNQDDPAIVREFLVRYQPAVAENTAYYDQLIEDALTYYREVYLPSRKVEEPGHEHDAALAALAAELKKLAGSGAAVTSEALQAAVFQAAKEREIKTKDWFRVLYRLLLGQSQGPRIGTFIELLGIDTAVARIESHLAGAGRS
jgi:lysyl-tRNA synthetase class 1